VKKVKLINLFLFSKDSDKYRFVKNLLKLTLIWCPVVSLLFNIGFGELDDLSRRFLVSMIIACTTASICLTGSELVSLIEKTLLKKLGRPIPSRGYFWGVLISYIFLVPGLYLGFNLAGAYSEALGRTWSGPNFENYSSGLISGIMISVLFLLFEVMREAKEAKREAEIKHQKLENEQLKAQVSALSAQMNPHLLFNSLNTIASMISTNPKSAEEMTVQLSELYRGVLKSAMGDVHTLESELALCKSYLDIEKSRFGDRVQYEIEIDASLKIDQIKIPVLLLQPLVENSIKHGLSPKKEGGTINIVIKSIKDHLTISVSDNGVGSSSKKSNGTGIGLTNCQSRINIRYGDAAKFEFNRTDLGSITYIVSERKE